MRRAGNTEVLVSYGLLEHELLACLVQIPLLRQLVRSRLLRVERPLIRKRLMLMILLGSLLLSLKLGLEPILLVLELVL